MKSTTNKIINGSIVICSTFLSLVIIECFFRIAFPQIQQHSEMFRTNERLGWEFIPNKSSSVVYQGEIHQYVETNKIGFRDKTFDSPDKSKILVIGDSFVSNISVPADSVFTEQLEIKFDSTTIINCGVNGYGQVQEYLLLQDLIPTIRPDLIIFQIYLQNDLSDNTDDMWLYPRPKIAAHSVSSRLEIETPTFDQRQQLKTKRKAFYKKIHLLAFIKRNLLYLRNRYLRIGKDKDVFEPFELTYCDPASITLERQLHVMKKIIRSVDTLVQQNNIDIIYTLAPSIFQVDTNFWNLLLAEYPQYKEQLQPIYANQQMLKFAEEYNLKMLDLTPILKNSTTQSRELYYQKEQHWTASGNRIVADYLYEYLDKNYSFK